jgi:hypothetical protein
MSTLYALSIYRGKPNIKRNALRVNLFHCHTYTELIMIVWGHVYTGPLGDKQGNFALS